MRRILVLAFIALCWILPASALASSSDSERIVIKGPVLVDSGETTGDVLVGQGDVTIRGAVDGDVIVADGDVTIRGKVSGDVLTFKGTAVLGRRAHVGGDVQYADHSPQVASGATVDGDVKKLDAGRYTGLGGAGDIILWVAASVSVFLLGLLLLLLAPKAADAVARAGKTSKLASFGWGLLVFILIPIYALGYTAAAFIVGRLIISKGARILAFLVGVVILRGLALIPFASSLIWLLVTIFGLGAIFTAILRARQ